METYNVVSDDTDLSLIIAVVRELVGQPCWRLEFIYGDELSIDFGARLPYPPGPLAGELHGEWGLVTRASLWRLFRADGSEIANADVEREESELRFAELSDLRVKAATVSLPDLDLRIEFDDGKGLEVPCCEDDEPDDDEDESEDGDLDDHELACWELYLPDGRLLSVYPERRWEVTRYRD
jgi:hypothetical protein